MMGDVLKSQGESTADPSYVSGSSGSSHKAHRGVGDVHLVLNQPAC